MPLFKTEPEKDARNEHSLKTDAQPARPAPSMPPPSAGSSSGHDGMATGRKLGGLAMEARAYLDGGSKVSGKISFEGPARIDGHLEGEIISKDCVMVGEGATVTAQIKAAAIVIAGKVSGELTASQRIEILPSARVTSNLTSPVLVIHEGAVFEGHCTMQPEAAREERSKVAVFLKEERVVAQAGGGPKQP